MDSLNATNSQIMYHIYVDSQNNSETLLNNNTINNFDRLFNKKYMI